MATFSQLPGVLDIRLVTGDEINIGINLGRDVSGYQFQSAVYVSQVLGGGGSGIVNTVGSTAAVPSIYVANETTGALVWSLNETQTQALSPSYTYRWYLRWVTPGSEMTRTILAGVVYAKAPGA